MSYKKFKFISPGIFITEIDNSQLPGEETAMGPALIGRTTQGPALKPVKVGSFAEYINMFGKPIPGGKGGDVFRDGNYTAPTYAAYAAQAWLRNNSPITMVRLLGQTSQDAANSNAAAAGWRTTNLSASTSATSNGGAFGLFISEGVDAVVSASQTPFSGTAAGTYNTGTLAAIWYLDDGAIALSGQTVDVSIETYTASVGSFIKAVDTGPTFKAIIQNSSGATVINSSFNFNPNSARFVRKVFNTNPTLTNTTISDGTVNYWLGESFEGNLDTFINGDSGISGSVAGSTYGVIVKLGVPDESIDGGDFKMTTTKSPSGQFAKTGWFISQDLTTNNTAYSPESMQKLFRFAARELGEETQRKVKISIQDLRVSTDPDNEYGTFSVIIRDAKDLDSAPIILEQYNSCNLNPASDNYIAKKIGNRYQQWDDSDRRYRYYGDYLNISNYVYVITNENVKRGTTNPLYLPFGVYGGPRYLGWQVSGSQASTYAAIDTNISDDSGAFIVSGSATKNPNAGAGAYGATLSGSETDNFVVAAKFEFPKLRLRISSSEGFLTDPTDAYFGVDTTYKGTKFDPTVYDVLRTKADDINGIDADSSYTENSWIFSLDDVRNVNITGSTDSGSYSINAVYESGSRASGLSYTTHTGSNSATPKAGPTTGSYESIIDFGFDRFTTCMHGGADGVDIKESEPFNNTVLLDKTETTSYAFNSVKVAIDSLRDPEVVEYNLLSMPGLTNNSLNDMLIKMCEQRADALAVIDLQGGYVPDTENSGSDVSRRGSVSDTVTNLKNNLQPNSSYGCAYYPWVQIRDNISGATLWAPPSVVAIGAMSYGEANSQLWFAPAGFTRGGLSANQAAGIPVTGVKQRLTSKERDTLYEAGVNPIATFPAEGIVIFGQKTLQLQRSALDRINVRRLVLYLKKQISRFAATILFDQNVETTWNRFKSRVEPFLSDVKAGLGITDYRLILDETTTTPDLIDRNIMYAKIYIKPARAIEYIAIDFIITDSGASFED